MAEYKVIQDIEAEDHLLGPLTLRQCIYFAVACLLGYLSFVGTSKGAPFLLAIFVPPMIFCIFFAFPWTKEQSTETWALARIGFMFKPKKRIWNQSGQKDLVTITAPKQVERRYTNGLSQIEVQSRLNALADTIDSRGWAVKNASVNLATLPSPLAQDSDRLVQSDQFTAPAPVSDLDIKASDDILDEQNNPLARQVDSMIQASDKAHRQQIVDQLKAADTTSPAAQPAPNYWFMNQTPVGQTGSNNVVFDGAQVVQPGAAPTAGPVAAEPTASEEALAEQIKVNKSKQPTQNLHLRTILPPGQQPPSAAKPVSSQATPPVPAIQAGAQPAQPVTATSDADILNWAGNDDLDIATIARQANKSHSADDGEVVISLR